MSDIKLFRTLENEVIELPAKSVAVEKSLQYLLEKNLEIFLGVRFLVSEYCTGKKHKGRIDTLGIDENGCPVIIEYKRAVNENVINQGLYYLDWLLDHQSDFKLLVMAKLGSEEAEKIEWSNPRLLCIAGDFTKYDSYAIGQINRTIELIRYRRYGEELLLLELVNASTGTVNANDSSENDDSQQEEKVRYATVTELLAKASPDLKDCFEALKAFSLSLGDDIQMKTLKHYFAFKRIKNFCSVEINPQAGKLCVCTKVDPKSVKLENGFTRDITNIGHLGTGNLEITIRSMDDVKRAEPLLMQSYEIS